MRKKRYLFLIIGLVLIVLVSSCTSKDVVVENKNSSKKVQEESKSSKEDDLEKIMIQFKTLISENKEPDEVVEFIDENIEKVSKKESVDMIKEFEKLQENYIALYTEELHKENRQQTLAKLYPNSDIDPKKIEEIKDEELKKIISKMIKGGYKIVNEEGFYFPKIDYEIFKKYEKNLSDELKEYLNIKVVESDSPAIIDGEITVSWDELGNRLIKIEKYLTKYPKGIKCEEVMRIYGEYLVMYMSGSDNTPIYNAKDKKIKKDIFDNYKKIVSNNKDTITANVINEYMKIIEKNNHISDSVVTSRLVELYNEAIGRFEECE